MSLTAATPVLIKLSKLTSLKLLAIFDIPLCISIARSIKPHTLSVISEVILLTVSEMKSVFIFADLPSRPPGVMFLIFSVKLSAFGIFKGIYNYLLDIIDFVCIIIV